MTGRIPVPNTDNRLDRCAKKKGERFFFATLASFFMGFYEPYDALMLFS